MGSERTVLGAVRLLVSSAVATDYGTAAAVAPSRIVPAAISIVRSLVIDTDTASDDAVALVMALREPDTIVRAVTVVAGNVPLDLAVRNAIITLDLCGAAEVPVHSGEAEPLQRPLETAQFVHGEDGMAGAALPEPSRHADAAGAVEALLAIARDEPGKHVLVTLGPLTNIARCLESQPDFLQRFTHTYLMAGSPDGVGNVNALGEFNVWADPEAASAVLAAPGDKTIIGWNISRQFAVMRPEETERLAGTGRLGQFCVDINQVVDEYCRETGLAGMDLPDPVAMAVALDGSIVTESTDEALVVGLDDPTRGAVLPDRRFGRPTPDTTVVWAVDEARFKEKLYAACAE